jgi:hypothetical protein
LYFWEAAIVIVLSFLLNSILRECLCNGRQDGKPCGPNPAVCRTPI